MKLPRHLSLASLSLFMLAVDALAADYAIHPEDRDLTAPFPEDFISPSLPPPEGQPIRNYATDQPGTGAGNFGLFPVHDNRLKYYFLADRMEYRWSNEGGEGALWDVQGFIGGDYNKLWMESEGEWKRGEGMENAYVELMYARSITSFWNLRGGVRYDIEPKPERQRAVLSLEGLSPYFIEVEFNAYVDNEGRVSFNFEGEFDIRLTQRLVLQPRLETDLGVQDAPEYNLGAGFTKIELGARLRYEISRKFAPYVGVSWESALGETADILEDSGEAAGSTSFVAGIRFWF